MVFFPEVLTLTPLECLCVFMEFIGAHELAVEIEHALMNFVWVSPIFGPVLREKSKNHISKLVIFGIMAAPSAAFCAVMSSLSSSFLESEDGKTALHLRPVWQAVINVCIENEKLA